MSRINHVKLVTPDPAGAVRFLTEVAGLPAGFEIPSDLVGPKATRNSQRSDPGRLTMDDIISLRGANGGPGFILGDVTSRQMQIISGDDAAAWAVAIGTADLDSAHERCKSDGYICTDQHIAPFVGGSQVRCFFAQVGGLTFEVMTIEPQAR